VTDGQTDSQNYDPQDRASIAASRGKNRFVDKMDFVEKSLLRIFCENWAEKIISLYNVAQMHGGMCPSA